MYYVVGRKKKHFGMGIAGNQRSGSGSRMSGKNFEFRKAETKKLIHDARSMIHDNTKAYRDIRGSGSRTPEYQSIRRGIADLERQIAFAPRIDDDDKKNDSDSILDVMRNAFSDIAWLHVVAFIGILLLIVGCERERRMQPEEIKKIVRREIEEIWNKGNLEAAEEIVDGDYVLHEAAEEIKGLDSFKVFARDFRTAFPNAHFDINDVIAEGDKVVVRYTFKGKHDSDYVGIASTSKEVTATGIRLSRVADGKLQETWNYLDKLSILVQLGWWVPPKDWKLAFTWGEPVEPILNAQDDPGKNRIVARRGLEALWSTGDMAIADKIYATNFVNHEITHRQYCDLESYKKYVAVVHDIMRDFRVVVEDLIAEGDKVAIRWNVSGTDKTSGTAYAWGGISNFRFSDYKIVEAWWSRDALGITQQMGIAPILGE